MQHRPVAFLLAIALASLPVACISPGDPWAHGDALKEAQRRYTEAIRWGDIDKAARFVDPGLRDNFLALADDFEAVRITDYEIGDLDIDPDTLASAEVDVTYRGYALNELVERRVNDRQIWYREGGNDWRVRPELALLIEHLGAHSR